MKYERPLQVANGEVQSVAARTPTQDSSSSLVGSLPPTEVEVVVLRAQGLTNREIVQRLVISHGTVRQHAYNLYQKLQVNSRQQAAANAADLGIRFPE